MGRMSQYERRGQGNACLGGVDPVPHRVTLVAGKGALGKWRAPLGNIVRTQCQVKRCSIPVMSSWRYNYAPKGRMQASA